MEHDSQPEAYCVHVWIRGIHPMLWRRFLVRSDSTLADLHVVLQIGFDWTDFHLHRFRIRKKHYAVPRLGGLGCRFEMLSFKAPARSLLPPSLSNSRSSF
jgi:Plasmid pRiA4b ORF-3-like protein